MSQPLEQNPFHIQHHAVAAPQQSAFVVAETGDCVTYCDLAQQSRRAAAMLRSLGLGPGRHLALLLGNEPPFLEICWAARQIGANYTPVSVNLQAREAASIIDDSDAEVLIVSGDRAGFALELLQYLRRSPQILIVGGSPGTFESYEAKRDLFEPDPTLAPAQGMDMLYSGGTTGRPKAIMRELPPAPVGTPTRAEHAMIERFNIGPGTVHLCTVPLYHALGLRLCMLVQSLGGTCVVMKRFDPELALRAIETYRCTHSVWVPTMFVRLQKLSPDSRRRYDLTSLQLALHAAAPCPVIIKEQMIDWWGPILTEFLASTEEAGYHMITSREWLAYKGSVGRCYTAQVHILDEFGSELPTGEPGIVYYENGPQFSYRDAPDKTAETIGPHGWRTVGDVGYLDCDGYLYVTGRRGLTINTGGVKVHPREVEDHLVLHPKVSDVAVIGVPHHEYGEAVTAIVQPVDMALANETLSSELMDWCRAALSSVKCPKRIVFEPHLPRDANGKLYRRELADRYGSKVMP